MSYDKNYYDEKKKKIEQKFNQVKSQLDQVNQQAKGLSEEILRLQGEHRAIEEIEKENAPKIEDEGASEKTKDKPTNKK